MRVQDVQRLTALEVQMLAAPDQQISLTDPGARSIATCGRGSGVVGYNVQTAVDTEHHLIVAHEMINVGNDRAQLASVSAMAKDVLEAQTFEVVADRPAIGPGSPSRCRGPSGPHALGSP